MLMPINNKPHLKAFSVTMANILYLYNSSQTYTNTVFEYLSSFATYSRHRVFFCHQDQLTDFNVDLSRFDAVAIHYSVRLPFDQISSSTAKALIKFNGLKFLFIQDEYDHTKKAWYWIKKLGIRLVFTVVPTAGIERIYPACEFPDTRFINILTGYVPEEMNVFQTETRPPSQRLLMVGYRGRPLPIRYGQLGIEKVGIGKMLKTYCDAHAIKNDISWAEEDRIYGPQWYRFIMSCRSMLGSESGSNVFDWDGTLEKHIAEFQKQHPKASDKDIYEKLIREREIDGIMNQVSPRIFETIAAKTVLVLFEGNYSGVIKAGKHFISVNKDGSNLDEVLHLLQDVEYIDAMVERAYQDIIASGRYSYRKFIETIDNELEMSLADWKYDQVDVVDRIPCDHYEGGLPITTSPIRADPPQFLVVVKSQYIMRTCFVIWSKLPERIRIFLTPHVKRLLRVG